MIRSLVQRIAGALIFLLLFLPFQVSPVLAEEVTKEGYYTLEKAISEALANNYQIRIRREQINEANYAKGRVKADFFPKFSTNYGYTRLDKAEFSDPISLGPGLAIPGRAINTKDNYQWVTSVRQPVFTGFSLLSTYRLAELGIDRSQMELELEKLDVILDVKVIYFNVIRADSAVNVARMEVKARESHLEVAKNFYEVGIIPINDLLKVEVELADAQQNLVKAESLAGSARAIFNTRLARPVELPVEVEDISAYLPVLFNLQESMDKALINRPEIKLTNISLLQADQQIRLAKSPYYPEISVGFDYIKEGDEFTVSGSEVHDGDRWQASALLSWTFWEWGKTGNAVKERLSQRKQLLETKASLVQDISLQLTQAGLDLNETERNIPTTKKAVEQAEENLRVNEERYRAQVTTTTEVLDAQTLLTQARRNFYNALIDHNVAKARLQRAMGEN